jgi:hypothetical protein
MADWTTYIPFCGFLIAGTVVTVSMVVRGDTDKASQMAWATGVAAAIAWSRA